MAEMQHLDTGEGEQATQPSKGKRIFREVVELAIILVLVLAVATLLKTFVIDQYSIPTGSMEPTIEINDRIFAEKISYHFDLPKPGDIITFDDPIEDGRILIKRCIATEGQTVDLQDGKVLIDGVAIDEPYTQGLPSEPLREMLGVRIEYPYTVPTDMIWVMGDNRTNSLDSRYFGPIHKNDLIGKAIFRLFPLNRFGAIEAQTDEAQTE